MREVGVALRRSTMLARARDERRRGWRMLFSLVCALAVLCVGAAPSWAASAMAWSAPQMIIANPPPSPNPGQPFGLDAVSCASSSLCVAVDGAGSIFTSTDPLEDPSSWGTADSDPSEYLNSVSCASTVLCMAAGYDADSTAGGDVITSSDPTDPSSTWKSASVPVEQADAVSCAPNTSLCVVGGSNELASTTGSGWKTVTLPGVTVTGVSCPSTSLCVASFVDGLRNQIGAAGVITSTNPNGGQDAWSGILLTGVNGLAGISCPTVSLCVAIVNGFAEDDVVTSTNPTGGPSAWSAVGPIPDPAGFPIDAFPLSVSCASPTICVVVGSNNTTNGEYAYSSTNPAGGPSAWDTGTILRGGEVANQVVNSVSCLPETSDCAAVDRASAYVGNAVPANTLTATLAGSGTGRVTGSPGISCPDICSNALPPGTAVALDATAFPGSFFAGWSASCTKVATTACGLMMSSDETITATFDPNRPTCSIKPMGSTVLLTRPRKRRRAAIDSLSVSVTCDQQVKLTLDATITAALRKGTRTIRLAPRHVRVKGGVPKKLSLKLPRKALVDLGRHSPEAMIIALRARGSHGSSSTSTTVPALHGKPR